MDEYVIFSVFKTTTESQLSFVLPHLPLSPTSLLIDIGMGSGEVLMAAEETYGCECVGIELDEALFEEARRNVSSELCSSGRITLYNEVHLLSVSSLNPTGCMVHVGCDHIPLRRSVCFSAFQRLCLPLHQSVWHGFDAREAT